MRGAEAIPFLASLLKKGSIDRREGMGSLVSLAPKNSGGRGSERRQSIASVFSLVM
jgi:hypothetical protein